jgi:hypothetical protein
LQPTYEDLKLLRAVELGLDLAGLQATYEDLKLSLMGALCGYCLLIRRA